jgi:tyrosinase
MVKVAKTFALALGICAAADASPLRQAALECVNPKKKQEWRELSDEQKTAYLNAQKCVLRTPQKLNRLPGAKTRWDELVSLHQLHAFQIHTTGNFLPYHRYFLRIQEHLLSECGYDGVIPYWDETKDAGAFSSSPIFDPVLGFGGTGSGANSCLTDGPFVNMTVNIGPGFTTQPRCVNRQITDALSGQTGQSYVDAALNQTTYLTALDGIYSGPHLWGHIALAMMNGDSITSPGDPLFIMHHGFVDKMWADWQAQDPARLTEIAGLNAQDPAIGFSEFPGDMEEESAMWGHPTAEMLAATPDPEAGDGGKNITLNHVLSSLGIIPDATVADVMDIQGGYLCYEYV